jgi:hypothetical protein
MSVSNKLGINESNRPNLLGKDASIIAWLPCLWQEIEATPSAMTLGVVEIAPHMSASNKLGVNQLNGSNLLGKNVSIVA